MLTSAPTRVTLTALTFALIAVACSDSVTEPTGIEAVNLMLEAQSTDGQVAALVVEVTGPGQNEPIVANFEFDEEGVATGELLVPVGQRTFAARAYHEEGFVTHQGTVTQVISPGQSHVHISLAPATGEVTVEVTLDQSIIIVHPGEADAVVGDQLQFEAAVEFPDGTEDPDAVVGWASTNTAVAEVDEDGVVTAYSHGEARISASHEGRAASAVVRVRSPFRDIEVALEDEDGQTLDALASIDGASAESEDPDWPLFLNGAVTPSDSQPVATVWQATVSALAGATGCGLQFELDEGAVTVDQQGYVVPGIIIVHEGGRDSAVEAACEITDELASNEPDMPRVAELTEVLIALLGLPVPEP